MTHRKIVQAVLGRLLAAVPSTAVQHREDIARFLPCQLSNYLPGRVAATTVSA